MSDLDISSEQTSTASDSAVSGGAPGFTGSAPDSPPDGAWWETPLSDYRTPVAVEPAMYGIDDDSGIDESRDAAIANGTAASATNMPFLDELQAAFGPRHSLDPVLAHSGPDATSAADGIGANAFATGSHVVFGGPPDLWTAAHEATHLVQQNAGVYPDHGIGSADDSHEQRADAVADLVVRGASADALLAEYAPFQLDQGVAQAAPAGSIVQLDRKAKKAPAPAPAPAPGPAPASDKASDASAFAFLKDGEDAVLEFDQGVEHADRLYTVVKDQASLKAAHERADVAYKDAGKLREKMLEVSTLEKVIGGVTAIVDFASSLHGIISAARTLQAAAALRPVSRRVEAREGTPQALRNDHLREHELRGKLAGKSTFKAVTDLAKGGDGVRKGVGKAMDANSDPDATLDPETILSNTNAAAIKEGNAGLEKLVGSQAALHFTTLSHHGATAELKFKHMVEGIALIAKEATPLTDESFARYKSLIGKFEGAKTRYAAAVEKVRALLHAYEVGGAAGLADAKELGVYEKIQEWKSTSDPRVKALRFALDQDSKSVQFGSVDIDIEAMIGGATSTSYYCYPFSERLHQAEDATLYVNDGPAATELTKLGLAYAPTGANDTVGDAERTEDKLPGQKFRISASIAKAIESLGIPGTANQARVQFFTSNNALGGAVANKHRGAWFEDWRSTPEFASFWKTHLGGTYGYLLTADGKRQTIPAAADDRDVMDRSAVSQAVQGGVL